MTSLLKQRCHLHPTREAAARCPECHRFFCRECITEHDHRVICATCLSAAATPPPAAEKRKRSVQPLTTLLAVTFTWLCFYLIGQLLLNIPSRFHEGAVWANAYPRDASTADGQDWGSP